MKASGSTGIELRHLQALVALTEEGTFTDAAIRLGISQSAVSRTVISFERAVGTRLVDRTTRSVSLTPAGVRSYRASVQALAALGDVVLAARGGSRPLRLGYAWSALGRHTSEVLRRWRAEHAEVALEIHRVDERSAGLTRGSVDIAVIRGAIDEQLPDESALEARLIFDEPRVAAVPVTHRLARRASIRLRDLAGDTLLLTTIGTTTIALWPPEHRPRTTVVVDNIDEWLTEIAGGLAVGVTAESTAALHVHPGIAFVPIRDAARIPVHLAWPAGYRHPATVEFAALVSRVVRGSGQ